MRLKIENRYSIEYMVDENDEELLIVECSDAEAQEIIKRVNEFEKYKNGCEAYNELVLHLKNEVKALQVQNRELMDVIKKAIKLISEGADGNALFFLKEAIKTYRCSLCGKEIEEEGLCEDCIIDQTEIIMSQEVE